MFLGLVLFCFIFFSFLFLCDFIICLKYSLVHLFFFEFSFRVSQSCRLPPLTLSPLPASFPSSFRRSMQTTNASPKVKSVQKVLFREVSPPPPSHFLYPSCPVHILALQVASNISLQVFLPCFFLLKNFLFAVLHKKQHILQILFCILLPPCSLNLPTCSVSMFVIAAEYSVVFLFFMVVIWMHDREVYSVYLDAGDNLPGHNLVSI